MKKDGKQLPEIESIPVGSMTEQLAIVKKMVMMQRTHNTLAKDIEMLTSIAKEHINNTDRIKLLIRACIKELFSLIEGDLYLINQFPMTAMMIEITSTGNSKKRIVIMLNPSRKKK